MDSSPPPPLHAMVLPFPAQGHINPMLHLSALLVASHGSFVTFVNTHRSHDSKIEFQAADGASHLPNVRFVSIPDGIPPHCNFVLDTSMESLSRLLDGIEQQRELLQEFITSSRSNPASPPISCIIVDAFFPWTQGLADELGIARVIFWTANVTSFYSSTLKATGRVRSEGLPFEKQEILSALGDFTPEREAFFSKRFKGIDEAACILLNSFRELENSFLLAVELKPPLRCVAPVFPLDSDEQKSISKPTLICPNGSLLKEEVGCLQWLDTQATSSVLYISFGSIVSFPPAQFEQLALGIEASEQPFLWVSRLGPIAFPDGFVDRVKDRGLIITWAPQLQVLEHPAISCFLTHCGWNSVLESVCMGVPMLCFPIFADQPMNQKLIVDVWKVGLGFEKGSEDGLVGEEQVKKLVMEMMHSEEGRKIRDRSAYWKAISRDAARKGGPSHAELELFVEDMVLRREARLTTQS